MKSIINDLLEEIKYYISKGTIDSIIPPSIFVLVNNKFNLYLAIKISIIAAIIIGFIRINKKSSIIYSILGVIGIIIASSFAIVANEATNYFLPSIILYATSIIIILISILIKKPIIAFISHLVRGWSIKWFLRDDIRPAYTEVSIYLLIYLTFRFIFIFNFYLEKNVEQLFFFKSILGLPFNLFFISSAYIYGIFRLKMLGGPGVYEFENNIAPPWDGQKKGF